jgi:hypothetical protein
MGAPGGRRSTRASAPGQSLRHGDRFARWPRSSWLARATGAAERIGYDVAGRSWLYTRVVPRSRELTARHSVVNQWMYAAVPGGGHGAGSRADPVEMPSTPRPIAEWRAAPRSRRRSAARADGHPRLGGQPISPVARAGIRSAGHHAAVGSRHASRRPELGPIGSRSG